MKKIKENDFMKRIINIILGLKRMKEEGLKPTLKDAFKAGETLGDDAKER